MYRKHTLLLGGYALLVVLSLWLVSRLRFSFDFEQFFPKGDPDYEFFKNFISEFETDDNFLLIAVNWEAGVFDSAFLAQAHDFSLRAADLPHVRAVTSLTRLQYPLRTPFGITAVPVIHLDQPEYYASDSARVLRDNRFVHNLISADGKALTIVLKTIDRSSQQQAEELIHALDSLLASYHFEETHILGRAYFQVELVRMEVREIAVSTVIAGILATAVLYFIFRRRRTVFIALGGIALSLLFFLAALSALGRELNALSALYPILMCIVGVADTIHITSKYLDELGRGHDPAAAIRITLREIGLATFITCITTALGFASLITNKTEPIQAFGLNAGLGVIIAFFTIFGWLWAVLPRFKTDQLIQFTQEWAFWDTFMERIFRFTKKRSRAITLVSFLLLAVCLLGISRINTNYRIIQNLPRGQKITADFLYFERAFSGFRPIEIAVFAQGGRQADDPAVLREIDKVEGRLRQYEAVRTITSINDVYRSLHAMDKGNRADAYRLPDSVAEFASYKRLAERVPGGADILLNRTRDKARITARMRDQGRDTVQAMENALEKWWTVNTDTAVARFKLTGTGLILDKNSNYIRDNMLQGLIPSVLIVALLMAAMFRDARIVLVFMVPNVFPLFFAGALIGYFNIPLEAGIATVFSIVFGIATDDTIHFLSTFRLCRQRGMPVETAIHTTLAETGKAMCLSSIILFFSFLVLLFSIHPPSITVGLLVSVTLAGALFCDLLLAPVMLRRLYTDAT